MRKNGLTRAALALALIGGLVLLASLIYLVVIAAEGRVLIAEPGAPDVGGHDGLLPAALGLGGLLLAALGLWLARGPGAAAAVAAEERRREHAERARHAEREWNRRLRREVAELRHERGPLGDVSDTSELVLRLAMDLVDARKGLLLHKDGDGRLEAVHARGFEHDPSHSKLVHELGDAAFAENGTVRRDRVEGEDATPADREIDSLVAIPLWVRDEFSGVVVLANAPEGFEGHEEDVLLALGDQASAVLENSRLHGEIRTSYLATVRMLADVVSAKDRALGAHSDEVARYATAVAGRLGLGGRRREDLAFGALLHDVGKVGVSERILMKPGSLTAEERHAVELHPEIGSRLVEQVPGLEPIVPTVRHHHERYDGKGYPSGLSGDDIPLEARVVAVLDSFSAMISDRPYRKAMRVEEACDELKRCAGTQFDPDVVAAFVEEVRAHPPGGPPEPPLPTDGNGRPERDGEVLGAAHHGITDGVTLLFSHAHFHTAVEAEARRAEVQGGPFAVVMIELPGLPELNRQGGFDAGDAALRAAARAIEAVAGEHEGTAGRESGRRLALLAPGADALAAEQLATRVASRCAGDVEVRCGAAAWEPGDEGEDVIARARASLAGRMSPATG